MGKRFKRVERCEQCGLQTLSCICEALPRIDLATRVVLVMHCRDALSTSVTGPAALACLPNSARYLHGVLDSPLDLTPLHENGFRRVLVLFPFEHARTLDVALEDPDGRPITLVVPDGDWRQARRIPRRVHGLAGVECVRLAPGPTSALGTRWEPSDSSLATFEAIARALGAIEGLDVQQRMETAFERLVQATRVARGQGSSTRVSAVEAESDALEVLYRDAHLVAVHKPAGLPSHRGWADDVRPALQRVRDQVGKPVYPVHRLDRATSGVLLFALSSEVARDMQAIMAAGDKRYLALCRGHDEALTRVDHPLAREPGAERREAITDFHRLGRFERYGLYEARPRTGRLHQIRRHLKHAAHPIVGDVRYGKGEHNRVFRERFGFHRLALHCHRIGFAHPRGGHWVDLNAPLDPDFARLLEAIGLLGPARAVLASGPAES